MFILSGWWCLLFQTFYDEREKYINWWIFVISGISGLMNRNLMKKIVDYSISLKCAGLLGIKKFNFITSTLGEEKRWCHCLFLLNATIVINSIFFLIIHLPRAEKKYHCKNKKRNELIKNKLKYICISCLFCE